MPGRVRWHVPALQALRAECWRSPLAARLSAEIGVRSVDVWPCSGLVLVTFDAIAVDAGAIEAVLRDALRDPRQLQAQACSSGKAAAPCGDDHAHDDHHDHDGHHHDHDEMQTFSWRLWFGGGALSLLGLKRLLFGASAFALSPAAWMLGAVTTVVTGMPYLRGGLRSLEKDGQLTTDSLISAATISSVLLRENVTAMVVLWLLNLGEYLQALTLHRTRRALQDLMSVSDREVWSVDGADPHTGAGGVETRQPVAQLQPSTVVAVYTGEKIPADGLILCGEVTINEAPVTGESMQVFKGVGEHVFAGTVVQAGQMRMLAHKVGDETVVGRLIARVEQAQELQAPIQTLGHRFARRFVPISFALSAVTFLFTRDIRRSLTMLVVACPCASGLATPTAVSASIGNAARRGVLIKGGTHLERVGRVDTVIFDKTGTLTIGQPKVTHVLSLNESFTPEDILLLAASGEMHSQHPLALAVMQHVSERELTVPAHEECEVLVGRGMRADLSGARVLVGSRKLLAEFNVDIPQGAEALAAAFGPRGETVLFVARNGVLVGLLGVADVIRHEAEEVLTRLRDVGVRRVMMLTGDMADVADKVRLRLGMTAEDVHAELFPEDKFEIVRKLQAEGHVVAMVGDGINDAPALAMADVGIAMGAAGSEIAIEAADIALASNDIRKIVEVIDLGQQALRVIRENYAMAIGVNGGGVIVGSLGFLNPIIAALMHNLSTILVIINSSRLLSYRPRGDAHGSQFGPPSPGGETPRR